MNEIMEPQVERVTWVRAARAEWAKMWSLSSVPIGLALTAVIFLGFGYAAVSVAAADAQEGPPPLDLFADPTHLTLSGAGLAQIVVAILGVLTITGEYSSGEIRSSFMAVPRRSHVLTAKAAVFGGTTAVFMTVVAAVSFALTQPTLESALGLAWPVDGHVIRAIVGAGVYLAAMGLLGLAIGALVRNSILGIAAVVGVLYVLPAFATLLPGGLGERVSAFLPADAGSAVMKAPLPDAVVGPFTGLLVLACYVAVLLAAAVSVTRRRPVR